MFFSALKFRFLTLIVLLYIIPESLTKAENIPTNFPSWFIKNVGQFNNESKYSLNSANSNTYFYNQYIVHQFIALKDKSDSLNPDVLNIRIDFENCNPHPTFQEREHLASRSNYFSGNDPSQWKSNLPLFGTLVYNNLYDKIDLVYYNSTQSKKSDFVVHAGGNYKDISLKYSGVTGMTVNDQGILQISSDAGEITEQIPEAYQIINGKKIPVKANFVVAENFRVKFEVQDYNHAYNLIIDPQLIYSSYFGGTNDEFWSTNVVRDSHQNIYFGGRTTSSNFPTTPGAYSRTFSGDFDAFILKLDPTGKKLIFSTFFGGTGQDLCSTIQLVGPAEDIMIVGLASGGGFPTTAGAFQTVYGGYADDMFVLKFNNNGNNLIFSTLVGGPYDEQGGDFCLDKNGDIYVSGYASYGFPVTTGAYQQTLTGDYDMVVFKLSGDGRKLLYSTFLGGSERDRYAGIALDEFSNVYITGTTLGDFPTTPGAFQRTFSGDNDIVAFKFDPTLTTLIFSTLIGGPGLDITTSHLELDKDNNLIFTGEAGSNFPTTSGAYDQTFNGGNTDCIIIKLKNDGSKLLYSSYLGGPGKDFARDFTIDNSGNLMLTGSCGDGFPISECTFDNSFNGGNTDCFLSIVNMNTSSLLYSTYLGGSNDEEGINITASDDTLLIVGNTNSPNLPMTSTAYDPTYNGGPNDVFFMKLLPSSGIKPIAEFNNPMEFCMNKPISLINSSLYSLSYKWDFGDGTTSLLSDPIHTYLLPGNYKVSLIASNTCFSDTLSAFIKVNGFFGRETVTICSNDSIQINGVYQKTEGNYDDKFLSIAGCDSIINVRLLVNPAKLNIQNPIICEGEIFEVGSHKYSISGRYVDVLKTTLGCDSTITTHLTVSPKKYTSQSPTVCNGESFKVGLHNYTITGQYVDTLKTYNGCDSIITTQLTVNLPKQIIQNPIICAGEKFNVGSNYYTLTGHYTDSLKMHSGCDSIVKTNLTVRPLPSFSLGNDTFICPGDLILLDPGNNFVSYKWSDGSEFSNLKVTEPGYYSVQVFDGFCKSSDTIVIDQCSSDLWFPNLFTPNGDQVNDRFFPVTKGIINSFHILIFNRWGLQLYESNEAFPGWDGSFNGQPCTDGVYYFVSEFSTGINPAKIKPQTKRGAVTLLH